MKTKLKFNYSRRQDPIRDSGLNYHASYASNYSSMMDN